MTARKLLYLVGEPIAPLDTAADEALANWLDADCSYADALSAAEDRAAFALAAYAATHDPLPGASEAVADALSGVDRADALAETRSDVDDLL